MGRSDMKRLFAILGSIFGSFGCQGSSNPPKAKPPKHAVLVHLKLSDADQGREDEREEIHRWSDKLEQAILAAKAGEFDGDEFGGGECTLYMYGPDADALFAAIQPL